MLGVEEAKHFVFLNNERTPLRHCRCRRYPQWVASQAGLTEKIAKPENGDDRLLACGGGYGNLYAAFFNVENAIGRVTLREECLPLAEFDPFF